MKNNKELTVINFYSGPGGGKSTSSAGLFHLMKVANMSVELVGEFAKEITWEKHYKLLEDQIFVFAEQQRRLQRLVGQVRFAITDSPLLLSLVYAPSHYPESFKTFCKDVFDSYTNINVLLERVKEFNPVGRNENKDRAIGLDVKIKKMLDDNKMGYDSCKGDYSAPEFIYSKMFNPFKGRTTTDGKMLPNGVEE
jgi:hypothetical protein